jgi:hypothetical protein
MWTKKGLAVLCCFLSVGAIIYLMSVADAHIAVLIVLGSFSGCTIVMLNTMYIGCLDEVDILKNKVYTLKEEVAQVTRTAEVAREHELAVLASNVGELPAPSRAEQLTALAHEVADSVNTFTVIPGCTLVIAVRPDKQDTQVDVLEADAARAGELAAHVNVLVAATKRIAADTTADPVADRTADTTVREVAK